MKNSGNKSVSQPWSSTVRPVSLLDLESLGTWWCWVTEEGGEARGARSSRKPQLDQERMELESFKHMTKVLGQNHLEMTS